MPIAVLTATGASGRAKKNRSMASSASKAEGLILRLSLVSTAQLPRAHASAAGNVSKRVRRRHSSRQGISQQIRVQTQFVHTAASVARSPIKLETERSSRLMAEMVPRTREDFASRDGLGLTTRTMKNVSPNLSSVKKTHQKTSRY